MNDWISVKDRLPDIWESVLVFNIDLPEEILLAHLSELGIWHCSCNCFDGSSPDNVTHWMPLPEPPKEEQPALLYREYISREEAEKKWPNMKK